MRFSTSRGGWGWETVWAVPFFFPLADFILVFELSFPSTPRPQDNVTTLGGLSVVFFACAPFEGRHWGVSAFHQQMPSVLSHRPSISLAVSAPSAAQPERLSFPVTDKTGCPPDTEKVAPLFCRIPSLNFS